ncbi:uncharacterized protein LOC134246781 [Saccostrea cucullata]|uniref:uncharacterized protein LOC134246781 n=1 Tax=Saccostrea cuccullata TaxID=36930 RepID=UPI002ED22FC6
MSSSSEESKSSELGISSSESTGSLSPPSSLESKSPPRSTSQWNSSFVDTLGVRQVEEGIFEIITQRWRLVCLTEDEELEAEKCLSSCDLQLSYSSLETVPATNIYESGWVLNPQQMEEIKRFPLLSKFLVKLDDFNFVMAEIIVGINSKSGISEGRYEALFDKLLQLFGLYTLNHSFISTEKTMIRGRSMSSKADIIAYSKERQKKNSERKVVFICEVKKDLQQEEPVSSPPRKKLRSSTHTLEEPECSFIGDQNLWMQHIGELFVYLDSSLSSMGTLGFTIEKTWVRVTYLEVTKSAWSKIKTTPGNKTGSLKYEEGEQPRFFYSKRYNFLNREDRKVLFKALVLIKIMQERRDKDDQK